MKKIGLFKGVLALFMALQVNAELIKLNVINGDLETGTISGDYNRYSAPNGFEGWKALQGDITHHAQGDGSEGKYLEAENGAIVIGDGVLATVAGDDYVITAGDIITVRFNQNGAGADRYVKPLLYYSANADGSAQTAISTSWEKVGFSGKSFQEGNAFHYEVPAGDPAIGKFLRIAFDGSDGGWARVDNVKVQVERPTAATYTEKSLKLTGGHVSTSIALANGVTKTVTYEAWFKRDSGSIPGDLAGIIMINERGLHINTDGTLGYHWPDGKDWGKHISLSVPENEWSYVALVINGDLATFYVFTESVGWQSHEVVRTHQSQTLTSFVVGAQKADSRVFKGEIDETRFWDFALTEDQLKYNLSRTSPKVGDVAPLVHYNYNEISGTTVPDVSGNGNDGAITGSHNDTPVASFSRHNSVHFDGGGLKQIAVKTPFDILGNWSMEFFIKRYAEPSNIAQCILTHRAGGAGDKLGLRLSSWNKTRRVGMTGSGVDKNFGYYAPVQEWAHYVFVRRGSDLELIVDGVSQGVVSGEATDVTVSSIGAEKYDAPWMELATVRIWDKALTSDEIERFGLEKNDFRVEDLESSSLRLYYDFNHQPGTSVLDLKGDNHGTLVNMSEAGYVSYLPAYIATSPEITTKVLPIVPGEKPSMEVSWDALDGVAEYTLELATNPSFTDIIGNPNFEYSSGDDTEPNDNIIVNANSVIVKDLAAGQTYFVRVKARYVRSADVKYDAAYSGYSNIESETFLNPGEFIAVDGDLITNNYEFVAGEFQRFVLTTYQENADLTGPDQLADYTGNATLKLSGFTPAVVGNSGEITVFYIDAQGNVVPGDSKTIVNETVSIGLEFNNGYLQKKVEDPDNPGQFLDYNGKIDLSIYKAGESQNIKMEVEFDTNAEIPTGGKRVFGRDDVTPGYIGAGDFKRWAPLSVRNAMIDSLSFKAGLEPDGMPITVNGGKLEIQPQLEAADAYGNPVVGDSYICTASAPDGEGWHVSGGRVRSVDGSFIFEKLSLINTGDSNRSNPSVTFSVSDGNGGSVSVASTIDGELLNGVGQPGESAVFDGTNYITTASTGGVVEIDGSAGLTYEFWMKATEHIDKAGLVTKYMNGSNNISIFQDGAEAGTLRYEIISAGHEVGKATVKNAYVMNEWTHIALIFDGSLPAEQRTALYSNGVKVGEYKTTLTNVPSLDGVPLLVGKYTNPFVGEMDEVRVWNRALTYSEIVNGSVNPLVGTEDGLVLNYKFDSGINEFIDISTSANHGWRGVNADFSVAKSYAMGCPKTQSATVIKSNGFTANWLRPVSKVNPSAYTIEVALDKEFTFKPIQDVSVDGTSNSYAIEDSSLDPFTPYYYRVTAEYSTGESRQADSVVVATTGDGVAAPGNCLQLGTGSTHVTLSEELLLDGDWSVQTWLKVSESAVDGTMIVVDGEISDLAVEVKTGTDAVPVVTVGVFNGTVFSHKFENVEFLTDEWKNLTFVYSSDSETLSLFVNGVWGASVSFTSTLNVVGISSDSNSLVGQIDEFTVSARAFSQSELREMSYDVKDTNDLATKLYYNFDLLDSSLVPDFSNEQNFGEVKPTVVFNDPDSSSLNTYQLSTAWEVPTAYHATNITADGFTASWEGDSSKTYILELSYDEGFLELIPIVGSEDGNVGAVKERAITGLETGKRVYYRVRYNETGSVFSNHIIAFTSLDTPGNCLKFSAEDGGYVDIPENPLLKGENLNNFTVEAWVMATDANKNGTDGLPSYYGIIGSDSDGLLATAPIIAVTGDTGTDVFFGFSRDHGEDYFATVTGLLETYRWTHLAMTYDGQTIRLYKNGSLAETIENVFSGPSPDKYISYIGKIGGTRTRGAGTQYGSFNGLIDEVRVWNYSRSLAEIVDNYSTEIDSSEQGLSLYYRFNNQNYVGDQVNTDIKSVYDLSSARNDGSYEANVDVNTVLPWKKSYAMVAPIALQPTLITEDGFTANWEAPSFGPVPTKYVLTVYNSTGLKVGGDEIVDGSLSYVVNGLAASRHYYNVYAISEVVDTDNGYGEEIKSVVSNDIDVLLGKLAAPGNAISFDGTDDFITIPQAGSLDFGTENFTIECWVKEDFSKTGSEHIFVCNKNWASNDVGYFMGANRDNGSFRFNFNCGAGSTYIDGSTVIADGTWHHVAVVIDRENKVGTLYVDGISDGSADLVDFAGDDRGDISTNDNIVLGAAVNVDSRTFYRGELDELRFWNSARTAVEIKEAMNDEVFYGSLPTELAAYYQFDEVGSVFDLTSNRHSATMNNFADVALDKVWNESTAMGAVTMLPVSGYTNDSFTVNWQNSVTLEADFFELQVSKDADFSTLVPVAGADSIIASLEAFTVSGLETVVPYFVRVLAKSDKVSSGVRYSNVVVTNVISDASPANALQFDGVDDLVVTSPIYQRGTHALTISAWVYLEDGHTGLAPIYFSQSRPRADQYVAVYINENSEVKLRWANSALKDVKLADGSMLKLEQDEWNHLAVSFYKGGSYVYRSYIDATGAVVTEEATTGHSEESVELYGSSYIGGVLSGIPTPTQGSTDNVGFFKGIIDELQVFNSSLTKADAVSLAQNHPDVNNPVGSSLIHFQLDHAPGEKYAVGVAGLNYGVLYNGDVPKEDETTGPVWVTSGAYFGAPEVTAPTELAEGGFRINWKEVVGADSYTVTLKNTDGSAVVPPPSISIPEKDDLTGEMFVIVSGLNYGPYIYEVVANFPNGGGSSPASVNVATTGFDNAPGYSITGSNSGLSMGNTIFGRAPDEFTVEFWIKPTEFKNHNQLIRMTSGSGGSTSWDGFTFHASEDRSLYVGTTSDDEASRMIISDAFDTGNRNDGVGEVASMPVWQHFAVTYNRGVMTVYKNGVLLASKDGIPASGPWGGLGMTTIDGELDEFRVWSKARTSAEIRETMQTPIAPNSDFLELYYRFDQMEIDPNVGIPDLTGRGLHATLSGFDLNPSYAMVRPVATSVKLIPVGNVDQDGNYEFVTLELSWRDSDILPYPIERLVSGADFDYQTTYIIQSSSDADFSTEASAAITLFSGNLGGGSISRTDDGYKYTLNDASGFDAKFLTTYYFRMTTKDVLKGVPPNGGDEVDDTFGYSSFSNILVSSAVVDAPGNAFTVNKEWPIYVEVDSSDAGQLGDSSFTVETWLNTTVDDKIMPVISTSHLSMENDSGFNIVIDNGKPKLQFGDGTSSDELIGDINIADGFWHHIAFVVDRTTSVVELYVDSVLESTGVVTVAGQVGDGTKLYIGQDASTTYINSFVGALDEIRVWSSARLGSQISKNMIVPVSVDTVPESLIAYYSCDLTSGNIMADIARQKNGVLYGETFNPWRRSAAMGSPQVLPPSEVYGKSFVANWSHANVDLAYLVAEDSDAGTYGYELEVANISSSVEVDDDDYDKLKSVTYKGNDEAASVSYILDSTEQPVSLSDGTAYFYEVTANYDIDGEIHSRKSLVRALSTSVGYFTPPGNSAFFSTSDERYVEINANIALETPDVTVSAWLKPSRPESGASGLGCFVGNRSSETSRYSLSVANDLSYLRIWVNDGASDGYSFPYQLEAEKWQFVTFVMTSSGVKVYVNGILIGEGAISLPEPLGVKLNIGSSNGTKEFFNGSIDEVRIWDHVRTEAQINEFMNFELDGTELAVDEQPYLGGLVAYYKFDNLDQNRILPDMSQNGLDGLVRTSTSGTWGISGALGCPNSLRAIDETKTSFTARWEAPESVIPIPDAADYELQVSNKSTFVNSATDNLQVQGEDGQVLFEVPITRLLASDDERSALLPNRSYYYRVRLEILPGIYRWSEPIVATTEMTAPGYALNFASADYQHVDMGKIAELRGDALPEFTIEAWVKPCRYDFDGSIDTDTNKDISGIVGGNHSYSNEASGAPFIAVVNNTDLQFGFANSFSSAGELIIPDVFTEVRWYHVAFTYKSTVSGGDNEMSIYVDGVNVSKDSGLNTSIAGPPVNNYIQYIGRYSNSVNQGYYDGIIDEVRIWNKWKSETDIRKNMFTQIAPADEVQSDGLVLYYRFNQTDGDVTYDLTTREQPAKLYGFETINSYQYWVKNVGDAIQFGNYSYEDIANDSIEHGVDYITVTLENEDDVVRVELLDINGDVLYEIDTNGSLIYTVSGDQVDNVVSAQTVKYSIGPRDYYVAISNFEVYEEGDRGYIDIKLESEIGVEAIYLIDVEDEKVIVLGVNGSYEYTERFDSYEEALDIDIVVLSKFYTESWNTSFVEFYNDGIIQGDPTLNAASSEVPVDGGLVVELANPGVGPIDTDKDFLVYGQAIAPKDEARFYTMTWGLDDPALASTQVTEQSWYVRNAYTSEGTSINITFDLRELGPGVYGDAPPPIDPETGVPLDPEKIAEYKVNFALSTSEDEDFQLLWSHVILESDTMVYKDLRASYPDIVLELAKDVPLEPGDPDTGVLPIYMTESHEDYYKIRFLGVPAEVVRGGRGYNGNYFALGSSLSLDNFVLTTALGLNAEVKASEDGAEISWTVESEKGVLKYTIQRRDANGDWITVAVVMADGTMSYTVVDSDYVDGAEYRIIASDRYGTTQAFSANGSSEFVTLSKGWNLISLPCADADISELLATASSGLWTWNGLSYEKLNSSPDALQAFWVHSDTEYDVIVEVSGTALTSSSVQLKPGWNLCGPAENCEVPATVEVVYGWQFSAYDEILKVDGEMMKTRGYWIFSTEEEVISLP